MAPVQRIVVGVDESDGAADSLRWAVAEADLHGAELTALMAWGFLDQHQTIVAERFDPTYGDDDALDALNGYVRAAIGAERAADVRSVVVCDLAPRALLDAARDADLLVVGARGLGGFRGLLLGSVSQHCLHHTTVPIAVVRSIPLSDDRVHRIVVGVDGSASAQRALGWAMHEARARNAQLDVVMTLQEAYIGINPMIDRRQIDKAAAETLRDAIAAEDPTGVDVRAITLHRSAASGLLDHAVDADLIVVGSRGHGPFKRVALGSVATQVTLHASCPVVVVPAVVEHVGTT